MGHAKDKSKLTHTFCSNCVHVSYLFQHNNRYQSQVFSASCKLHMPVARLTLRNSVRKLRNTRYHMRKKMKTFGSHFTTKHKSDRQSGISDAWQTDNEWIAWQQSKPPYLTVVSSKCSLPTQTHNCQSASQHIVFEFDADNTFLSLFFPFSVCSVKY